MNCGCESGKRYEFHFDCLQCMARHYVLVLGGDSPRNRDLQKARRAQLKRIYGPEKFEEFRKLVEVEKSR